MKISGIEPSTRTLIGNSERSASLFLLFTKYVFGETAQQSLPFSIEGQLAIFFSPQCPNGWEPIETTKDVYLKFSDKKTPIQTREGVSSPFLSEENTPEHTHLLAGPVSEDNHPLFNETDYLSKGPYGGTIGYTLKCSTEKANIFETDSSGLNTPDPIPVDRFSYSLLCKYTSIELRQLNERLKKIEDALIVPKPDLKKIEAKIVQLKGCVIGLGCISLLGILKMVIHHYKLKTLEKKSSAAAARVSLIPYHSFLEGDECGDALRGVSLLEES